MSHEDFDLESLAEHLHLSRDEVTKMAERGKLPGRRIAGKWRFARAEVHHWWEQRISSSGSLDLARFESVLERTGAETLEPISFAELLPLEAIALPLVARTRGSAIAAMTKLAVQTGMLWDADKMLEAVRTREDLAPTALDNGVALLHPRRPLGSILAGPFLALGITMQGIPFGNPTLTDVFFLICSTEERGHLRVLARLSRLLAAPSFLKQLRAAVDAQAIRLLIAEYESTFPE